MTDKPKTVAEFRSACLAKAKSGDLPIEQPWNDQRLLMGGVYIGCGTKENADQIIAMRNEILRLKALIVALYVPAQHSTNFSQH